MEEEIRVLEEAVRVSAERQARAEAMRFDRKREVEAERRAAKEEAARMEEKRRTAVMKAERQADDVELTFQISDWLQLGCRLLSD